MRKCTILLVVLLVCSFGYSQSIDTEYVRKNANSPGGRADLNAMKKAFDIMRDMDCKSGLSWYSQGAMHNTPSVINGPNQLCQGFQGHDKMPNLPFGWDNCTHEGGNPNSSFNFLLWHRMYIWHLEKVVRELSGVSDFALPYWDYTEQDDRKMPELLTQKEESLYTKARLSSLNNGQEICNEQFDAMERQMMELKEMTEFQTFSKNLNNNPHGVMHNYIGGGFSGDESSCQGETMYNEIYQQKDISGLMGNVESAGFDPVFWLHHSKIDYIWQQWMNSENGKKPSEDSVLKHVWPYNFIQPDGSKITYTMQEVYDIVFNLDYTYQGIEKSTYLASRESSPTILKSNVQEKTTKTLIWEHTVGKTIADKTFVHEISTDLNKKTKSTFRNINATSKVLDFDVVVYKEPKDFYTVYIRYEGEKDSYIGTMSFFGVAHEHGIKKHSIAEKGVKLNFSFDISDELKDIQKPFSIYIKKHGNGTAKVTIENLKLFTYNKE